MGALPLLVDGSYVEVSSVTIEDIRGIPRNRHPSLHILAGCTAAAVVASRNVTLERHGVRFAPKKWLFSISVNVDVTGAQYGV